MATSPAHHVLVVSDSLDLALIRTAQSTQRNLLPPMSSHLAFGAGGKCEKTVAVTIRVLRSRDITNW